MTWLATAVWAINTATATWAWTPASGPVAGYSVRDAMSGVEITTVTQPSVSLAILDRTATSQLAIVVRAFDVDGNLGPESLPSEPVTGVPLGYDCDWDGDGQILANDFSDGFVPLFKQGVQSWPR